MTNNGSDDFVLRLHEAFGLETHAVPSGAECKSCLSDDVSILCGGMGEDVFLLFTCFSCELHFELHGVEARIMYDALKSATAADEHDPGLN